MYCCISMRRPASPAPKPARTLPKSKTRVPFQVRRIRCDGWMIRRRKHDRFLPPSANEIKRSSGWTLFLRLDSRARCWVQFMMGLNHNFPKGHENNGTKSERCTERGEKKKKNQALASLKSRSGRTLKPVTGTERTQCSVTAVQVKDAK